MVIRWLAKSIFILCPEKLLNLQLVLLSFLLWLSANSFTSGSWTWKHLLMHHLRVSTLQTPSVCDASITVILRIKVQEMTKVTSSLADKEFCLCADWKLSLFLSESYRALAYMLHQGQLFSYCVLFKGYSLVATLWDKYNFLFNVWSDYSLCGDYLWRGLSHSTVTRSCTCKGKKDSAQFLTPCLDWGPCENSKGGDLVI